MLVCSFLICPTVMRASPLLQEDSTAVANALSQAVAEGGGSAQAVSSAIAESFNGGNAEATSESIAQAYGQVCV